MRSVGENDPLLTPLLRTREDGARRQVLQTILATHAAPHVARLLDEELARGRVEPGVRPDLESEITLRLIRKLRQLGEGAHTEPIRDFADYVSATTHNVLDDQRRRQDPVRSRLATRVRYVLTHTPRLALWGRDPTLCGLTVWKERKDVVAPAPIGTLTAIVAQDAPRLRRILLDVLERSNGPVDFRVLVDALADALGIDARPFTSADVLRQQAIEHDPLDRLSSREYLRDVWAEIQELPERQRRALLLHLRLGNGDSVCRVFVALGVVTMNVLAATLGLALDQLLALWNELPLGDQRISEMLGATRQQVINLRKSARDRLGRRMRRTP